MNRHQALQCIPVVILILATIAVFTATVSHRRDNPIQNARHHVQAHQQEITQLVTATAQARTPDRVSIQQPPMVRYKGKTDMFSPDQEHTTTVSISYQTLPQGSGALRATYVLKHQSHQGRLRHLIPGPNHRVQDAYLDAASVHVVSTEPLRLKSFQPAAGQPDPIRITASPENPERAR